MPEIYKARDLLILLFIVLAALPWGVVGFGCSTPSNITLVNTPSNPQLGNANDLKNGEALPWPKFGKHRPVRFCYANHATHRALSCKLIIPAFTVWGRELGFPAGPVTGHSVGWRQASDPLSKTSPPKPLRCYGEQYKSHSDTGPWNPDVSPDTLAIHVTDAPFSSATVGYTPDEWDSRPGRHYMHINPTSSVSIVVHEVRLTNVLLRIHN